MKSSNMAFAKAELMDSTKTEDAQSLPDRNTKKRSFYISGTPKTGPTPDLPDQHEPT